MNEQQLIKLQHQLLVAVEGAVKTATHAIAHVVKEELGTLIYQIREQEKKQDVTPSTQA